MQKNEIRNLFKENQATNRYLKQKRQEINAELSRLKDERKVLVEKAAALNMKLGRKSKAKKISVSETTQTVKPSLTNAI